MELKKFRNEMHKTQAQVAADLNITPTTYQNYELGRREPDISTLIKMAEYFHVTIDALVGYKVERFIDTSLLTETQIELINKIKNINNVTCVKLNSYLDGLKDK